MTPAEQVAAALAATRRITLRDLQIALEWQRDSDVTVLDILVYLQLVDTEEIRKAANSLKDLPELSINHGIAARQAVDTRRQFKRIDLPDDIEVSVDGQTVGAGPDLLNLSLGGLGYSAASGPAIDDRVSISIHANDGSGLETSGRVRYCREVNGRFTVGVEFDELGSAEVMVLDAILKDLDS